MTLSKLMQKQDEDLEERLKVFLLEMDDYNQNKSSVYEYIQIKENLISFVKEQKIEVLRALADVSNDEFITGLAEGLRI